MTDDDDIDCFNESLGEVINGKYTNYPTSNRIEAWQILSPTKFVGAGSYYLNNVIHRKYRQDIVDSWNDDVRTYLKPQSNQNIVYGDKVIANTNGMRKYWDGEEGEAYIANGEIGIMCNYPGQFGWKDKNRRFYKFRFGSFDGKVFSYTSADFGGEERDSQLELAYALTVHKAQGSGFDQTIVVINGRNAYLSKELLYTAFSRQENRLVILSDVGIEELLKYSIDWYSDTKQRFTDLFTLPEIEEIRMYEQKRYFAKQLIHRTSRGEFVRSKSEVIIANLLFELDIDYVYEEPLKVGKKIYLPDFTLRHKGRICYLEHLGLLGVPSYERAWEKKKKEYEQAGISEAKGNLLITEDGSDGSLDAFVIRKKILAWLDEG